MRRRRKDETVAKLRERTDVSEFETLTRKCTRWALDASEALSVAEPIEPPALDDRQADNWEPLLAIADLAGGKWPARARSAALALSGMEETDEENSINVLLLGDIRQIFNELQTDRVPSATLIERLGDIQEHPWATFNHGKIISPRQLAKLLKSFEIRSQNIRADEGKTPKGYYQVDFQDAFDRYLTRAGGERIDPLLPPHDSQQMTFVADSPATVADLWRQKNESNSLITYHVADTGKNEGGEYKEQMVTRPEEFKEKLAAKYREHVRECLFCAIEEGEVVELCPDGKAMFDEYLRTPTNCRMAQEARS